jgi:hypothetical protein
VAAAAVAQTQHREQPLIPPVIRPDCFFWVGLFLWRLANQVWGWVSDRRQSSFGREARMSVGTTHRATFNPSRHPARRFFLGGFVFVVFGEPTVEVDFWLSTEFSWEQGSQVSRHKGGLFWIHYQKKRLDLYCHVWNTKRPSFLFFSIPFFYLFSHYGAKVNCV